VTLRAWSHGALFGRIANGKMRRNPVGREVAACWNRLPEQFAGVALDAFALLPDRLCGIVLVPDPRPGQSPPLAEVLNSFISVSARRVDCGIWKGSAWGRAIRGQEELKRTRHSILQKPSRWQSRRV
jgi:hypothetical protein